MTSSSNVFEHSCSYYNPATKKWDSGCFTLNKNHVQFVNNSSLLDEQYHLCLTLNTITGIEKRQSNLIYPSLVICVGSERHWFGSFPSRDAVYNLLDLFWREVLLSKPHRRPSPPKAIKTDSLLGKELLGILNESKNTLIETANVLSDQSRQLYEAEEAVEDINNDLSKAEKVIRDSSLPLTLACITKNYQDSMNAKVSEVPSHRYKVTFSFSNHENKTDWEKGVLIISIDVIILKQEDNVIMQVTRDELEAFQVLSPWELCIIHKFSGIMKSCFFMCPQLSRLLKFISSLNHYKEKINYVDDDSSAYDTASCYSSSSFGSAVNTPSPSNHSSKKMDLDSSQNQVDSSMLSDEEIHELNNVLQDLQTLAAEVGKEQEQQVERITSLVENMDKTELRIKNDDKLLKKKM